jgi:hypothetical protein
VSGSERDAPPGGREGDKIEFTLSGGGPAYSLFRRMFRGLGLFADAKKPLIHATILIVALTWLPLAILCILEGTAWGNTVTTPFFRDISVAARFLVALPIFIVATMVVDRRLAWAVNSFVDLGMISSAQRAAFDAPLNQLAKRRNSVLPEVVLIVASFGLAWGSGHSHTAETTSSWMAVGNTAPLQRTPAGIWLDLVSMPICMLFILTWLWRILLWADFLRQTARLDLRLLPTHPDRAGGLGFLGEAQQIFGIVLAPVGVMVAARMAVLVQQGAWSLDAAKTPIAAMLVLGLLIAFGPLLAFAPKLARLRREGIEVYGGLAQDYVREFDRKWVRGEGGKKEEMLGTGDIQSLADIGNSFSVIREMKVLPIEMRHVVAVVALMYLPMIPIIATVVPIQKMVSGLINIVTSAR